MMELKSETIWFDQRKFEEAESQYQRSLVISSKGHGGNVSSRIFKKSLLQSFEYEVILV